MVASRLLGLGKEKLKFQADAYCDLDEEDLEELAAGDSNPVDHDLAAVVRRYLSIKMDKTAIKLGGSDWGRNDLSEAHYNYALEDVGHLPVLWNVLEQELREAKLESVFRERMRFFPHLNEIKMTGIPIDVTRRDIDFQKTTEEKTAVREDLRKMFEDCRHPIPKSRRKSLKIQTEAGNLSAFLVLRMRNSPPRIEITSLQLWPNMGFSSTRFRKPLSGKLMLRNAGSCSNTKRQENG